jgi:hypothetical protein
VRFLACGTYRKEAEEEMIQRAASLPVGSRVDYRGRIIEYRPSTTIGLRWRDDLGNGYSHIEIDLLLADGARVLCEEKKR